MLNGQRVAAILVAAGASRRMGFDKLSYAFDGKTVLQHSVQALAGHPYVDEVVAAASAANEAAVAGRPGGAGQALARGARAAKRARKAWQTALPPRTRRWWPFTTRRAPL